MRVVIPGSSRNPEMMILDSRLRGNDRVSGNDTEPSEVGEINARAEQEKPTFNFDVHSCRVAAPDSPCSKSRCRQELRRKHLL